MLPINLIYDFQLLERGVPVYCNNQFVHAIAPINENWYYVITTQEIVYANSHKVLHLSMIENEKYQDARWN